MKVDALRELFHLANDAGVPERVLTAAAEELVELLDRPQPDPRRVRTLAKARRIRRAIEAGASRPEILARFGVSPATYHRLLAESRDSRDDFAVQPAQSTKECS
jgi:hypothetical protein